MERNRWEAAVRCLEIAVCPDASDAAVIAAVNVFRHAAEGTPLSQVCIEFACGGVPLAVLAQMKESLERLNRENLELRQKLAADEAAQAGTQGRLDAAYRRIHELSGELLATQHRAGAGASARPVRPAGPSVASLLTDARLAGDRSTLPDSGSGRLRAAGPRAPQTA